MKTHRCSGSLEQQISIRYTCSNPWRKPEGDHWELQSELLSILWDETGGNKWR